MTFSVFAQNESEDSLPPVFAYYPSCQYSVIDTVQVKRKMLMKNNSLDLKSEHLAYTESIEKLRKTAAEEGAIGIILTRKNILSVDNKVISKKAQNQPLLQLTAELIGACEDGPLAFSDKPAPLDVDGKAKLHLELGTIAGWQKEIVLDIGDKYEKRVPTLKNDVIDFEQVYGLALGASVEQAISAYGTPSLHLSLGTNQQLLGFGRNHWLLFIDNQLEVISSKNQWLSSEVVNYVPFDERFSEDWAVLGKIAQKDSLSVALSHAGAKRNNSGKKVIIPGKSNQLVIWYDGVVEGKDKVVQKVTDYTLQRASIEKSSPQNNPLVYSTIQQYLQQEEQFGLDREQVQPMAIGEIWQDKMSKILLFNGNLLALVKGESVSKLYFLEQVFNDAHQPLNGGWVFNRVKQGQSMEEVLSTLGDEAFGFDDTLEVSAGPYSKELFFHNDRLVAAEVAIF